MNAADEAAVKYSGKEFEVRKRSTARLAAVQALYEMDIAGASLDSVLREFLLNRWNSVPHGQADEPDGEDEKEELVAPDRGMFDDLVRGVSERIEELDGIIEESLSDEWPLDRLEVVLKCILRAGAYELLARPDIPIPVVISEYLEVAHAFYAAKEPGLVNGVLDHLAQRLRTDEIKARK
ncbi:MAG: transcription antitermination factor NusB [Rhodospirillales bacterium]